MEKIETKNKYLKNRLSLYSIIQDKNKISSAIFYTNPSLMERSLCNQVNKKTTLLYLIHYNLVETLKLNPKFPNYYLTFNSPNEITDEMRLNSLYIKISNIFCSSQIISFSFLNFNSLSFFLNRIFYSSNISLFFNFFVFLKSTASNIYEFNE